MKVLFDVEISKRHSRPEELVAKLTSLIRSNEWVEDVTVIKEES